MPESYSLLFLPLEFIDAGDIPILDSGKTGPTSNTESDYSGSMTGNGRLGKTIHTGDFGDSAYVSVTVADDDGVFQDQPAAGTQTLAHDLDLGGKTWPAGTEIHTGYRLDFDIDGDGVADLSVYAINAGPAAGARVIGLASTKPIPSGAALTVVGGDNYDGADIVDPDTLYCFAAGTMIATPSGEMAVEALAIGDPVLTADGRTVPVRWIGRQTLHKAFTPRDRFSPVRIAAGALGGGIPSRDLVLTADHALILDGFAINAGALVNGHSIGRVPRHLLAEQVTYYHVETELHDIILANGTPAETFLDQGDRRKFDNYAEYLEIYGRDRIIREMALPRIGSARMVPRRLRRHLAGAAPLETASAG